MRNLRAPLLLVALFALPVFAILLTLPAQARQTGPIPYTPGTPLFELTATRVPRDVCYPPLAIQKGQTIYIQYGVNLRNEPTRSSAIVWNTSYNNDEDRRFAQPVIVDDGPVCSAGLNWWRVSGLGNPGWVAEGRPDEDGYYLIVPGITRASACTAIFDFEIGKPAVMRFNTRLREAPSTQARTKTVVPFETEVLILAGPECVEGLRWWAVRATVADFTYEGWMAEGVDATAFLEPEDLPSLEDGTLCGPPLPLAPGQRAFVSYRQGGPKSLRAAPGTDGVLLFSLVRGVPFIVEDGPICRENLNWWKVSILASAPVVGWMAEGSSGVGYWIDTVNPDEFRGLPIPDPTRPPTPLPTASP